MRPSEKVLFKSKKSPQKHFMKKTRPQCGLIIENAGGEILLQLRDNKPGLEYPNCWGTFGGQIEEGETPQGALVREIKEELDYNVENPKLYRVYLFIKTDMPLVQCTCIINAHVIDLEGCQFPGFLHHLIDTT